MTQGLDSNDELTDYGGHLKELGYVWGGRYIDPNKPMALTMAEAQQLTNDGLYISFLVEF